MKAPTVISTFSGCGGSSLGYKLAGLDVRLAVEFDSLPAAVYRDNHDAPVIEVDVRDLTGDDLLKAAGLQPGELDVFDGSPPCQDFSRANALSSKRVGSSKQLLVFEYARLVRELQPRAFVMENVAAMTQGRNLGIYRRLVDELRAAGYATSGMLADAQFLGVAQRRRRLILLGARNDHSAPVPITPQTNPIDCTVAFENMRDDLDHALPSLGPVQNALWDKCKPGDGFDTVHERQQMWNHIKLHPDRPSPSLTCAPSFYHWDAPRVLTIAELARIASFPDDFRWPATYRDCAFVIGNCVPPEMMRRISLHVRTTILDSVASQ